MFQYSLKFCNISAHANVDALSRVPLLKQPAEVTAPLKLVLLTEFLSDSPITADCIRSWTRKDPVLAPVVQFLQQG